MKTKEIDGVLYKLVPEEKEKSCKDYNRGLIKKVDEPISNYRLKPFNLEAAKAGKPVCTRDGRKARIICFDRIDNTGLDLPIVALIQCEETEILQLYREDGKRNVKVDLALDLMMLLEKKTGWININKDGGIFKSREEAERNCSNNYVVVEVEWEE